MENLKIRVNSKSESKEAQQLFFELGYEKGACSTWGYPALIIATPESRFQKTPYSSRATSLNHEAHNQYKEITLPELRDMVVLKRNDVGDANAHRHDNSVHYYITSDNEYFFFLDGKWACSNNDISYLKKYVKPIKEKDVKEFLVNHDNKWTLQLLDSDTEENSYRVAVPSGATHYSKGQYGGKAVFFKVNSINQYEYYNDAWLLRRHPLNEMYFTTQLLWQRSGTESLNDQYAEIEKVRQETVKVTIDELKHRVGVDATLAERQATYGSFEDVAFVTENVMGVLSKARPNGLSDLPHTHRMALYMIASKMARIVNGDFNHLDSWHDIGGYAKLIENLIGDEDE